MFYTIAIPFEKSGFINFWRLVKIDESKYLDALVRNRNIIRIDNKGFAQAEAILRAEKTRLIREQNEPRKATYVYRISRSEKQYKAEFYKKINDKIGTIVL